MTQKWFKLTCSERELQLLGTLNGGQSFRWSQRKTLDNIIEWIGVFADKVWILRQTPQHILYQVYENEKENVKSEKYYNKLLGEYFHLELNLDQYFNEWGLKDPIFKKAASQFYGIRILKQDLIENIFSFICSSNNNISRITSMVEKLAVLYGEKICDIESKPYYAFPNVESLAKSHVENDLKTEKFGYRAKYINLAAKNIIEMGNNSWLENLKELPYEKTRLELMNLTGVGPKVADCICLMSLNHLQAIPVDTHVYQIAKKFYMPQLPKQKSVTTKLYQEIGDNFREIYGPLAGWAHTVLFCADLKKFQ